MANSLPVSRNVNVAIQLGQKATPKRNFGSMLILGDSDVIGTNERLRNFSSIEEVADAFGTRSCEYESAVVFFGQSPKPANVYIGRWVRSDSPAVLQGAAVAPDIEAFKKVADGAFSININKKKVDVKAINLSEETNLNGVASKINDALKSSATCVFDGERFVIQTSTRGADASIEAASSTELSSLLGIDSDVTISNGISGETLEDAVSKLLERPKWYGLYVAANATDEQIEKAGDLINAASTKHVMAFTCTDPEELDERSKSTAAYKLRHSENNRVIAQYSSKNKHAAASILGKMATVDFNAPNAAITLKFKACPEVQAEDLAVGDIGALEDKNINIFTEYADGSAILQEGKMLGGAFIDEIHGLDWLENHVQMELWNALKGSPTKFGQDAQGSNNILTFVNRAMEGGVHNGVLGAGQWRGESFGALSTGDALPAGYYVYIQPHEEQSQTDREQRICPPIKIAAKLKGAVHFVNVVITVNR